MSFTYNDPGVPAGSDLLFLRIIRLNPYALVCDGETRTPIEIAAIFVWRIRPTKLVAAVAAIV